MLKQPIKICLISSSGGHLEQLKMLKPLSRKYNTYIVTEQTQYQEDADYTLLASGGGKLRSHFVFIINIFYSLLHLLKEKPDVIISTGSRVAIPTIIWGRLFKKKVIYIETFARVTDGTKSAKIVYKNKLYDLFLYQWEQLGTIYPDGVYGGSIY